MSHFIYPEDHEMTTRKSFRRFFALFLLFALLLSLNLFGAAPTAWADKSGTCGKDGDNLTWTFRDGTLTISGEGEMADYDNDHPAPWDGMAIESLRISDGVTSIGSYAFLCWTLRGVSLPDSLTSIRDYAFYLCVSLTGVNLPDSLTFIGDGAFVFSGLTRVALPDSLTSIGSNPFSGCSELAEISVSPEHPTLAVIDGALYSKADRCLVCCPSGREYESLQIPDGIQSIGDISEESCVGKEC